MSTKSNNQEIGPSPDVELRKREVIAQLSAQDVLTCPIPPNIFEDLVRDLSRVSGFLTDILRRASSINDLHSRVRTTFAMTPGWLCGMFNTQKKRKSPWDSMRT